MITATRLRGAFIPRTRKPTTEKTNCGVCRTQMQPHLSIIHHCNTKLTEVTFVTHTTKNYYLSLAYFSLSNRATTLVELIRHWRLRRTVNRFTYHPTSRQSTLKKIIHSKERRTPKQRCIDRAPMDHSAGRIRYLPPWRYKAVYARVCQ